MSEQCILGPETFERQGWTVTVTPNPLGNGSGAATYQTWRLTAISPSRKHVIKLLKLTRDQVDRFDPVSSWKRAS